MGAFLKLCWGLNGSSELWSVASEAASLSIPFFPCVMLLSHMSSPVAKALSRLLLLPPYPLCVLPPCSDSALTVFSSMCCSWWFSFPSLWHYFNSVLLQHPVVCPPLSCSSVHDYKRVLQSTHYIFWTFDVGWGENGWRNDERAYGQHIWNYNYW